MTLTASAMDGTSNADAIQFTVAAAPAQNGSPTPMPTLFGWGTVLLSLLLAGLALRRQRSQLLYWGGLFLSFPSSLRIRSGQGNFGVLSIWEDLE